MKIRTIVLVAMLSAILSADKVGAGQTTGLVQAIGIIEYSAPVRVVLLVQMAPGSSVSNPPGCAPTGLEYSFDLNTVKGRAALQILQSAVVTGLTVRIGGNGSCAFVAGNEDGNLVNLFAP